MTDFSGIALAPCSIRTTQGNFRLLAYPFLSGFPHRLLRPDLGDDDQADREDDDRADREDRALLENAAEYIRTTSFEKTVPLLGELATLNKAMLETEGSLKRDWRISDADELDQATLEEQIIPPTSKVCAFGIYSAEKRSLLPNTSSDERALLLVAGDAEQVVGQLSSEIRFSRGLAFGVFVPTAAVLAFMLFAPWSLLRAVPWGGVIIEKQEQRLKEALAQNDLHTIADAIRYVDPHLAFEEAARTPLMLAKSVEAAHLLLERGASIDAHDSNGYSVLMNAAERGSPDLIRFLISRGARVNEGLPSYPGHTPLAIARDRNTADAVDVLLKAGATDEADKK